MIVLEKRTRQGTEARQTGLVVAALQLAAQHSPANITTGDLAQAVGITQGAVFRHFESKEAIWLAVMDWVSSTLMEQLQAAAAAPPPSPSTSAPLEIQPQAPVLAALRAVFLAHVDFVITHPGVPRLIFQELQHAQDTALKGRVRALMQRYRLLVADLLQQAQEQQLLAPNTDLASAAVLFMGSVQGLLMQAMLSGQVHTMAAQAPGVFAIYLRGITVKATP